MQFDWDTEKAKRNITKHGVSFEEAKSVFDDPLFLVFFDHGHSFQEGRLIIMGESAQGNLLIVSYTERHHKVRLISARKTTNKERKFYESEF
ncbi:MAG: BrnT family toxin [Synechocystis sp.]|nr:BrnT family toxin [Synechocystis sp.]